MEHLSSLGGIVLAVSSNVSTSNILNGDVLDVETNIVSGKGLWHRLVVHLHRFDLRIDVFTML